MSAVITNGVSGLEAARSLAVPNIVRDKLNAGILNHAFSIKMCDNVAIVQFAASVGYDAILIDLEHSSASLSAANQLSVAALSMG